MILQSLSSWEVLGLTWTLTIHRLYIKLPISWVQYSIVTDKTFSEKIWKRFKTTLHLFPFVGGMKRMKHWSLSTFFCRMAWWKWHNQQTFCYWRSTLAAKVRYLKEGCILSMQTYGGTRNLVKYERIVVEVYLNEICEQKQGEQFLYHHHQVPRPCGFLDCGWAQC